MLSLFQNIEYESQIKGEFDKKVQEMVQERLSFSRDSIKKGNEMRDILFQTQKNDSVKNNKI